MGIDTFEGWCTPVSMIDPELGKYADHTFVYCSNRDSIFGCWSSGDRSGKDAARVCSGCDDKAYCRADNYRISLGPCPDTAGVGIYAVNGVCHQSANLFLYASNGLMLPMDQERPRGIWASCALYGPYGANIPGAPVTYPLHFASWLAAIYAQAALRCIFTLGDSAYLRVSEGQDLPSKIMKLHLEGLNRPAKAPSSIVPQEMQVLLSHYIPGVDEDIVRPVHEEIMARKDEVFSEYGLVPSAEATAGPRLPTDKEVDEMVQKLNGLALEFQSHLAERLGAADFKQIIRDGNYYKPVDPEIARQVFAALRSGSA